MKIDCKHVWSQVSDYIDGTVTSQEREAIERHLANCRHCSAVMDFDAQHPGAGGRRADV